MTAKTKAHHLQLQLHHGHFELKVSIPTLHHFGRVAHNFLKTYCRLLVTASQVNWPCVGFTFCTLVLLPFRALPCSSKLYFKPRKSRCAISKSCSWTQSLCLKTKFELQNLDMVPSLFPHKRGILLLTELAVINRLNLFANTVVIIHILMYCWGTFFHRLWIAMTHVPGYMCSCYVMCFF